MNKKINKLIDKGVQDALWPDPKVKAAAFFIAEKAVESVGTGFWPYEVHMETILEGQRIISTAYQKMRALGLIDRSGERSISPKHCKAVSKWYPKNPDKLKAFLKENKRKDIVKDSHATLPGFE